MHATHSGDLGRDIAPIDPKIRSVLEGRREMSQNNGMQVMKTSAGRGSQSLTQKPSPEPPHLSETPQPQLLV